MKAFLLTVFLFSIAYGQQLISLNTFKGDNVKNHLNATSPYSIYVSATSDNDKILSDIFVVYEDGEKFSLEYIKQTTRDRSVISVNEIDSVTLTTSLPTTVLKKLTGVIYLSTTAQWYRTGNFHVVDINKATTFNRQTDTSNSTILFLNTCQEYYPTQSSVISEWKQDPSSVSFLYTGVPGDEKEPKNTHIFSNPVVISNNSTQYFSNVEEFTLSSTVAFYLRTFNGGPSFVVEAGGSYIDGTTTTAYSTTGFFMSPQAEDYAKTKVHIQRDTSYSGTCGANMLGSLENHGNLSVSFYDASSSFTNENSPNSFFTPWSIPVIEENLSIKSTPGAAGYYYVQYFVLQGKKNESTSTSTRPIETTTTSVEGTTSSSNPIKFLTSILIFISVFKVR